MNVQLDKRKCKACWKCIEECPNSVINKVDLPWHKHAVIVEPDKCSGCLKCVRACQYGALSHTGKTTHYRSPVIYLLAFFGLLMIISGLVLQVGFHMGSGGGQHEHTREIDTLSTVWGIIYPDWSSIHKITIIIFSLLMIIHIKNHWCWYKRVVSRHLIHKNKQVITLSIFFLLVAITGFVPWFIDLSGNSAVTRLIFIEFHDKLSLILVIYLILHIIKRRRWFMQ